MKYAIILILLLAACSGNEVTGAMSTDPSLQQQVVKVGVDRYGYTFQPSAVEANRPVKFIRDPTLQGCAMFMISPELGIKANFMANEEYIFVPENKGTFNVMCSMNMHRGTLTVK